MVFPNTQPFDENQPKSKWYRDNEYFNYHCIKGHDTKKCIKLKIFIKNIFNDGEIEVEGGPPSKNAKFKIFQKSFLDHNNDNNNGKIILIMSTKLPLLMSSIMTILLTTYQALNPSVVK